MKTTIFTAVALVALALAGCNTVHGAGQDLKASGNAISTTADKTSNKMSS